MAVAGALTAPGLALAQSANVSIYGLMDVRWDQSKYSSPTLAGTAAAPQPTGLTKQHLSTGQTNYIGFRGSEDLGGGLSAFFDVQAQIFTDARPDVSNQAHTNGLFGGRPTYLGLRSTSWGEVSGGYQDSVYKDVQKVWNVGAGAAYGGVLMGNGNSTGSLPSPNCVPAFASGTNNLIAATGASTQCSEAVGNGTSFNLSSTTLGSVEILKSGSTLATVFTVDQGDLASGGSVVGGSGVDVLQATGSSLNLTGTTLSSVEVIKAATGGTTFTVDIDDLAAGMSIVGGAGDAGGHADPAVFQITGTDFAQARMGAFAHLCGRVGQWRGHRRGCEQEGCRSCGRVTWHRQHTLHAAARGIAELLREVGQHRFDHARIDRRRCCVV